MNLIDQFVSLYRTCFLNLYSLVKNVIFFTFEGKKIFSTTQEFAEHELVKKGTALKEIYKEFLKKTRLRKDVYLIEYPHPMCFAVGSQFPLSKNSHAAIFMSQGLYQLDPQAFSFLFKHEVAHIKFCDVAMSSVTALIGIVAAAFAASFFSFVRASGLSLFPASSSSDVFLGRIVDAL